MPAYMITDNQTGKKFKVTGDSPPTESEMAKIFLDMSPKKEQPQAPAVDKSLMQQVGDYYLGEMPDNPILSKEYITQNVPRSIATLPVKAAVGIGKTAYDLAKSFTDPAMQAGLSMANVGNKLLGGDADYFDKDIAAIQKDKKTAGQVLSEGLHGTAKAMLAPMGVYGVDEASKAWNDPAMALAGIAPTIKAIKGVKPKGITPEKLDSVISKQYQEAVRPSVSGTAGSAKQFKRANKNSVEGVYDIVKAKDRGELALGDEMAGQIPVNKLPENIQEHLQAINQAKTNAFVKYDAMKKAAGEAGAEVSLQPAANDLLIASKDPVLNDLRPGTAKYMEEQANVLLNRGKYTADQAQTAIATLNKDVESFMRNPTPDMAGKMAVDATILKYMRQGLDDAITAEKGPGYQPLKNEYGRLAGMEKDAAHRARIAGRAAPVSLVDAMGGFLGSGEIVSGILSMNPAQIAKGGTVMALKSYIKKINSPDYKIKQMYKLADKKYVRP